MSHDLKSAICFKEENCQVHYKFYYNNLIYIIDNTPIFENYIIKFVTYLTSWMNSSKAYLPQMIP